MLDKLLQEFKVAQNQYLARFGEQALDRVLLVDPVHLTEPDLSRAINQLNESVATNRPLTQMDKDLWDHMVF